MGAALRFLATPAVVVAVLLSVVAVAVAFRVTVAFLVVVFAFSTMLVSIPAPPVVGAGAVGFKGETGRAR